MKSVSAVIFALMMPSCQAQSEEGALLQVMSGLSLTADAGLDKLDRTKEWLKRMDNIAKENNGRMLRKDITEFLKELQKIVNDMDAQLKEDHQEAKKTTTAAFNVIKDCNTVAKAKTGDVTTALKEAADAMTEHDKCRESEKDKHGQSIGADGSCTSFKKSLGDARECSGALDQDVPESNRLVGIFDAITALETSKTNCKAALGQYQTENKRCTAAQEDLERKTCAAHHTSGGVCGLLDTCHAQATVKYGEACEAMKGPQDDRQTQALAAKSLLCKIQVLLTANPKTKDVADCDVKTDAKNILSEIKCEKAPEKLSCSWPTNYEVAPGVEVSADATNWFDANYKGKGWFGTATNNIKEQDRISKVEHTCDDLPVRGANKPAPAPAPETQKKKPAPAPAPETQKKKPAPAPATETQKKKPAPAPANSEENVQPEEGANVEE